MMHGAMPVHGVTTLDTQRSCTMKLQTAAMKNKKWKRKVKRCKSQVHASHRTKPILFGLTGFVFVGLPREALERISRNMISENVT